MESPVSYFNEDKTSIQIIVDLLQSVYQHYAVGYQHFTKRYPGYLKMEEIVGKKMDRECNDADSLPNRFFKGLKVALPGHDLENRSYINFPSYSFVIRLLKEDIGIVVHEFTLDLVISLVSDYYTIALIDSYGIRGITKETAALKGIDSRHSIYSFLSSAHRVDDDIIPLVTQNINRYFSEKRFVSHSLLMEPPLLAGIAPFGGQIGQTRESSFWELLFSNDLMPGAVVLE